MNLKNYNQYEEYYLRNACGIVTYLNILKYRYAIFVIPSFILKLAIYLENIKLFNSTSGAVFDLLYRGITAYLNYKLGLKFKVVVKKISQLEDTDDNAYGIGIKGYSSYKWGKISLKGYLTKKDMDYLKTFSGGIGHNTLWDGTGGGYHVDTNGKKAYKFPLYVLKYGQTLDLLWDNIRTIEPADKFTEKVVHYTIRMFEAEKKGKLREYLEINKNNKYIAKSEELYLYGRQ